jgi:hypothetical protein
MTGDRLSAARDHHLVDVELHALHPPALAASDKGHLLPDFYSGATGLPGRFSEGFLLRRLQGVAP